MTHKLGSSDEVVAAVSTVEDRSFENFINLAVEKYLKARMGNPTFKVINYYLHDISGMSLSQIAEKPSDLEAGLCELFGVGAPTVIRACIFAAYRAARIIPDREYIGFEDAFTELRHRIAHGADHDNYDVSMNNFP